MKRFFKGKGPSTDPTPYPIGAPPGSYESFTPPTTNPPSRSSDHSDYTHSNPVPHPPPTSKQRFLNLGHSSKDTVTPYPLAPSVPPSDYERGRNHGDAYSMDVTRGEPLDRNLPESKMSRRVSMKGHQEGSRGMFGFAKKDKDKVSRSRGSSKGQADVHEQLRTPHSFDNDSRRNSRTDLAVEGGLQIRPWPNQAHVPISKQRSRGQAESEGPAGLHAHPGMQASHLMPPGHMVDGNADYNYSTNLSDNMATTRERSGSNGLVAQPHASQDGFIQPHHVNPDGSQPVRDQQYRSPEVDVRLKNPNGTYAPYGTNHLAVPSDAPPPGRRSGEFLRSSAQGGEPTSRPSTDVHESKGGLRAMFGGGRSHKEDSDQGHDMDESKRKKAGFFGLGSKDDEKGKFGRRSKKNTPEQDQAHRFTDDETLPPSRVSLQESADRQHAFGRFSPNMHQGYPNQASGVATPGLSPRTNDPHAVYPQNAPIIMSATPPHVPPPIELSKKERDKAIREAQERTREQLKAEKRERERADKDAIKAEKETQKRKGERGSVTYHINDLCSRAYAPDYPLISELCERIAHSNEDVAKEAARAIRKAIKYGGGEDDMGDEARVMGMKIWLLGCMNCPEKHGLRAQATSKRFLQSIEPLLIPDKDSKIILRQPTYDRLRDTLAHLNFNFGNLKGSEHLRELWGKVKTPDEPEEGYPFATTDAVFTTTDRLLRQPLRAVDSASELASTPLMPSSQPSFATQIPNEYDDLNRLSIEVEAVKEHARVLQSTLMDATARTFEEDPIIKEFYATCVRDQESLVSQMAWANAQAEKAREQRGLASPDPHSDAAFEQKMNGLSMGDEEPSFPERVFMDLLAASEELTQALKLHEDMERDVRDDRELRYVQERSKTETRMNRSGNTLDVPQGGYVAESSRSRSPSPYGRRGSDAVFGRTSSRNTEEIPTRRLPIDESGHSRSLTPDSSMDLSAPRLVGDGTSHSPTRLSGRIQGPRPIGDALRRNQHSSSNSLRSSQAHGHAAGRSPLILANDFDREETNADLARSKPSAKALGKRRVVPTHLDTDDVWRINDNHHQDNYESSSEDDIAQYWERKRPTKYVYDALRERENARSREVKRDDQSAPINRQTELGKLTGQGIGNSSAPQLAAPIGHDFQSNNPFLRQH